MVRPGPVVKKEVTSDGVAWRKWVNTELCYAHSQAQLYVLQHMNYGYVLTTQGCGQRREIYAFYREAYTLQ